MASGAKVRFASLSKLAFYVGCTFNNSISLNLIFCLVFFTSFLLVGFGLFFIDLVASVRVI